MASRACFIDLTVDPAGTRQKPRDPFLIVQGSYKLSLVGYRTALRPDPGQTGGTQAGRTPCGGGGREVHVVWQQNSTALLLPDASQSPVGFSVRHEQRFTSQTLEVFHYLTMDLGVVVKPNRLWNTRQFGLSPLSALDQSDKARLIGQEKLEFEAVCRHYLTPPEGEYASLAARPVLWCHGSTSSFR